MKSKFYLIVLIIFALFSCGKNDLVNTLSNNNMQEILSFSSYDDLIRTVHKVSSMTTEERILWEGSKRFKSFGTICDNFYSSIEYEKFKDINEIKQFVQANNKYIELIYDENREMSCVVQQFDNPERFIMNKDRMYIVGNKAYKIFPEQKKVSCDIERISELVEIKDLSELSKVQYSDFELIEKSKVSYSTSNYDQYYQRTEAKSIGSKNYRTIVRVEVVTLFWNSLGMPGTISYAVWYKITNQSQFIVWWNTDAITEYAPFEYRITNGSDVFNGIYENGLLGGMPFIVNDNVISAYIGSYPYHAPMLSWSSPYFVSFHGFVNSTFTRGSQQTKITVNLKYPY